MTQDSRAHRYLKDIPPEQIVQNPDNPRLFFRSEELDTLMASIRKYGIQVPISVYEDGDHFVLIDGERRWRCARKLNIKRIPALIQPKPTPLANLLLMFNIHALREQWDYLTIANKLPDVVSLFKADNAGRAPNEGELSEITGLTRGQIRRCNFLLELPPKYRKVLEQELAQPKHLQTLSEDFFIEMEKALKTVQKRVPAAVQHLNSARDALIKKFRGGLIGNITDFRKLSKIATSISNIGVKEAKARSAISDILDPQTTVGIQEVFAEQFEMKYDQRKIVVSIESLAQYLKDAVESSTIPLGDELRRELLKLRRVIDRALGS